MYGGGYAGKLLRIDLSNQSSQEEVISEEDLSYLSQDIQDYIWKRGRRNWTY